MAKTNSSASLLIVTFRILVKPKGELPIKHRPINGLYPNGFGLAALALQLLFATTISGCRAFWSSDKSALNSEPSVREAMTTIYDDDYVGKYEPPNKLDNGHRRPHLFPGNCGYEQSKIHPFRNVSPQDSKVWFDEDDGFWRLYARPVANRQCDPGEKLHSTESWCYGYYGLQFFPSAANGSSNHYIVNDPSPIIRMIPRKVYPSRADSCKFDNDTALIWVSGVTNWHLSDSWRTTTNSLLGAISAWNRNSQYPYTTNSSDPPGHDKLKGTPGYIQIVYNFNSPTQGAQGAHDERAIERLVDNLEMAYRSGIRHLEVVSHSNGMITTQVALRVFTNRLVQMGQTWRTERRSNGNPGDRMKINVFHTQAAPHTYGWSYPYDRYESISNFLPNFRWIPRQGLFDFYNWEWDFSSYNNMKPYVDLAVRFYYNGPDWMTFPQFPRSISSVGRNVSLGWHEQIRNEGYRRGVRNRIVHYNCSSTDESMCPPGGHDQENTLWYFSAPQQRNPNLPLINWDLDMATGVAPGLGPQRYPSGGSRLTDTQVDSIGDLPADQVGDQATAAKDFKIPMHTVCLDASRNRSFCEQFSRWVKGKETTRMDIFHSVPMPICYQPGAPASAICQSSTCGDGICGIGEKARCPGDCPGKGSIGYCSCGEGTCVKIKARCTLDGCEVNPVETVTDCSCASPNNKPCNKDSEFCQTETEGSSCRSIDVKTKRPGIAAVTQCVEGSGCQTNTTTARLNVAGESEDSLRDERVTSEVQTDRLKDR